MSAPRTADEPAADREELLLRLHTEPCVHYPEDVVHRAVMGAIRPFMDLLERFYLAWAGDADAVRQPAKQVYETPGVRGDWRLMPCAIEGRVAADFAAGIDSVKVIGSNEEQRVVGDKISVGKALLLHRTDHHVEAIFDVAALSSFRTAAISVLAARHCGYGGTSDAAIVGAGRVGYYTAAILRDWLGCPGVVVHDVDESRNRLFVETVAERFGGAVRAAGLEATCRDREAIFLATSSQRAVLDARRAAGSRFISSVGADADNLSELDPDLLPGRVLVSESAQNIAFGDLRRWHAAGLVGPADIHLLADVVAASAAGRPIESPAIFVSTGTAVQDGLACRFLHDRLHGRGGQVLGAAPPGQGTVDA